MKDQKFIATVKRVAAAFGCNAEDVEVRFGVMRDGSSWTVSVRTLRPKARGPHGRRDETFGGGDTLEQAEADCIRKRETHTDAGFAAAVMPLMGERAAKS